MKCIGRNRGLQRCRNDAKLLFCHRHFWQPYKFFLVTIPTLILLYIGLIQVANPIFETNKNSFESFEESDSTFKVILLPFKRYENCAFRNMEIESRIADRLMQMNEQYKLNLNVRLDSADCISTYEESQELAERYNANMIVFGDLYEKCNPDTSKACVKYKLRNIKNISTDSGNTGLKNINGMEEISEGYLQEDIDYIVFWSIGISLYNKHNYGLSIKYLENIKLIKDRKYSQVYYALAFCNMWIGKYENAISLFSDFIELDSSLANAYQNRGICFSNLYKRDSAHKDFNKAISIDRGFAQAYLNRGSLKEVNQDLWGAYQDYSVAVAIEPDYYLGYWGKSRIEYYNQLYTPALGNIYNAIYFHKRNIGSYNPNSIKRSLFGISTELDMYSFRADMLADIGIYSLASNDYEICINLTQNTKWKYIYKKNLDTCYARIRR